MDDRLRDVFLSELKKQCEFAMGGVSQINNALKGVQERDSTPEQSQFYHNEVFRGLHSFLTHSSNVSRILWPPFPQKKKKETNADFKKRCQKLPRVVRSETIKDYLGFDDGHILKERRLRDHLEHYDERLDDWGENSEHRNIVTDMIGDPRAISGIDEKDRMRTFNPNGAKYIFRGEEYDVQAIASSIEGLLKKLNEHGVL
jgi:hypothetical protein